MNKYTEIEKCVRKKKLSSHWILRELEIVQRFIIDQHYLSTIRYTDDITLIADAEKEVQKFKCYNK